MQGKHIKHNSDGVLANFRYQRKWKRITSVLSVFVVAGTISSLMLPAITMNKTACSQDEHTHGSECFSTSTVQVLNCNTETLGIHKHTSDCKDAEGTLICNQVDFVVHKHDSTCADAKGVLVCTLKEVEEHRHEDGCYRATEIVTDEGHTHTDACFQMVTSEAPTCSMEESSGHKHGEGCYAAGTELSCTETESDGHSHGDGCYSTENKLTCTETEESGHVHEAGCYIEETVTVCTTPESTGHKHGEGCYYAAGTVLCTTPENDGHQHSESCYGPVRGEQTCTEEEREPVIEPGEPELICGKNEVILHTHGGTCFEYDNQGNATGLVCGKPEVIEHQHTDACFTEKEIQTLTCETPEHIHTDECKISQDLTEEELTQVDALAAVLTELPTNEDVQIQLAAFEETQDEAGKTAYLSELTPKIAAAMETYNTMTDAQKTAVTGSDKLLALTWLLEEADQPTEETLPPLTEEEAAQVEAVSSAIAQLPAAEHLEAELGAYAVARDLTGWENTHAAAAEQCAAARSLYDALDDGLKARISNYDVLTGLEQLLQNAAPPAPTEEEQTQILNLTAMIEELPAPETVEAMIGENQDAPELLDILKAVEAARAVYDEMPDLLQRSVENYEKLTQLESVLEKLALTGEEQAAVNDVISIIEGLPPLEEIQAEISRLEESGDAQNLNDYKGKIQAAVTDAFRAYEALNNRQRAAVTNSEKLEQYRYLLYKEETLTQSADGYTITIRCGAETQIPADAELQFQIIGTDSQTHASYLAQAQALLPEKQITDAQFFDISILHEGEKIQPAADVELTITFDTPMAAQALDSCQIIHFADGGTELLYAQPNRDREYVYGMTFSQGSFSVSGALLTQPMAVNETDIGKDNLPISYYVHINGTWEKVGETSTGWISGYNGGASSPNGNYDRDYITEEQVASILGSYGFKSEGNSARTIVYQNSADGVDSRVWSDTTTAEKDGVRIIPLSLGTGHYNIYFLPDNTTSATAANRSGISSTFGNVYQFYTLEVYDPQKIVFQTEEDADAYKVIFRSGTSPSITLPKPISGDWQFLHDNGQINNDHHFVDNGDGTMTGSIPGLTQHMRAMPKGTSDFGPDEITVTYMVHLDGTWQVVGTTEHAWKGDYTIDDWSNPACRDAISVNQIYSVLAPYGFDMTNTAANHLAYQQQGELNIQSDTSFSEGAGHKLYPMSKNKSGTGYLVYYIPGNAKGFTATTSISTSGSKFYSVTVKDDQNWIYTEEELAEINSMSAYIPGDSSTMHSFAAAVLEGETAEVTVERAGWAWMWFKSDGTHADEIAGANKASITFEDTDEGDGLITMTRKDTQHALILDAGDKSQTASTASSMSGDIQTVSGQGITFKLFDYRADINELLKQKGIADTPVFPSGGGATDQANAYKNSKNYFAFRDEYTPWKFETQSTVYDRDGYHHYSSGDPDHTTVYRNLSGGYPRFDMTHKGNLSAPGCDGTSMNFLFSGNEYVRQYNCVNTPLRYDTSDGYYKYSSVTNAADYDTASNTWYVRSFTERGASTAEKYPGYADFLPFNNGNGSTVGSVNGNGYQYEIEDVDYWFGMTMSVNFFQGKDGCIEHNGVNKEMEFHFSGDDDVWLFIDDMLVLDIGGTHGAVDGTVNFHTGLVKTWYNFNNDVAGGTSGTRFTTGTLYEYFKAAYMEKGLSGDALTAKLNEIFVSTGETVSDGWGNTYPVYRFKNYSSHSMKFFYMERGADASNCSISFNLPTLPDESLIVGKELEFDDSTLTQEQINFAKENLTYRFRVIDANGDPLFTSQTGIRILNEALKDTGLTTSTDADGWFTLKAGQRVQFEHMLRTLQELDLPLTYYVQEAIPSSLVGQYNGVVYKDGGTSGDVSMEGTEEHEWVVYKTGALSPENTYTVIYTNKVDVEKMSFLQIRKEVAAGSVWNGSETFPIQVLLGGEPVPEGTQFKYVTSGETVTADASGTVHLKAGDTLQLTNPVIAGTAFTVKELEKDGWVLTGYTASVGTVNAEGVNGEIPVGATVLITVTNRTFDFSLDIPVSKEFRGARTEAERTATFRIEQVKDIQGNALSGTAYPAQLPGNLTITCTGSAVTSGVFTINYSHDTPNGTYYYKVTETGFSAPNESFVRDESVFVVKVTVANGAAGITGLYKDGESISETTAAFVNHVATAVLPETGSAGITPYTFSGLAIMVAACALMYITTRKQRKGAR